MHHICAYTGSQTIWKSVNIKIRNIIANNLKVNHRCWLMTWPTCVGPVVLLRAVLEEDEAASLLRFLSWLRQWGRGWACRVLKDMEPMGWQDTERGQTGMATVMYEVGGWSVLGKVWIEAVWGLKEFQQGFDKEEHRVRDWERGEGMKRMSDELINKSREFGRTSRELRGTKRICLAEKKKKRKKALVLLIGNMTANILQPSLGKNTPKKLMLCF